MKEIFCSSFLFIKCLFYICLNKTKAATATASYIVLLLQRQKQLNTNKEQILSPVNH